MRFYTKQHPYYCGINLHATKALAEVVSVPIIASGGVTDLRDIEALLEVDAKISGGITGVITGRALYEGTLDLGEAIALVTRERGPSKGSE